MLMLLSPVGWWANPRQPPTVTASRKWEPPLHVRVRLRVLWRPRGAALCKLVRERGELPWCVNPSCFWLWVGFTGSKTVELFMMSASDSHIITKPKACKLCWFPFTEHLALMNIRWWLLTLMNNRKKSSIYSDSPVWFIFQGNKIVDARDFCRRKLTNKCRKKEGIWKSSLMLGGVCAHTHQCVHIT